MADDIVVCSVVYCSLVYCVDGKEPLFVERTIAISKVFWDEDDIVVCSVVYCSLVYCVAVRIFTEHCDLL